MGMVETWLCRCQVAHACILLIRTVLSTLRFFAIFRCLKGEEENQQLRDKQAGLDKQLADSQAALRELSQMNQTLQVGAYIVCQASITLPLKISRPGHPATQNHLS